MRARVAADNLLWGDLIKFIYIPSRRLSHRSLITRRTHFICSLSRRGGENCADVGECEDLCERLKSVKQSIFFPPLCVFFFQVALYVKVIMNLTITWSRVIRDVNDIRTLSLARGSL